MLSSEVPVRILPLRQSALRLPLFFGGKRVRAVPWQSSGAKNASRERGCSCLHPPLKGEGRRAQRAGAGSVGAECKSKLMRWCRGRDPHPIALRAIDLPLPGGGEEFTPRCARRRLRRSGTCRSPWCPRRPPRRCSPCRRAARRTSAPARGRYRGRDDASRANAFRTS